MQSVLGLEFRSAGRGCIAFLFGLFGAAALAGEFTEVVFSDSFEPFRADLKHRWTFGESGGAGTTLLDDIGGANGLLLDAGDRDGRVDFGTLWLNGGSRANSDYAELPGFLLSGLQDATIEIWASQDALEPSSHIFAAGTALGSVLAMTWNEGGDASLDQVYWNGSDSSGTSGAMAPYVLGIEYQIVLTVEEDSLQPGTSVVSLYRDGVFQDSFRLGQVLADLQDDAIRLGRSPDPAQATAAATYNEVRIYDGAMPPEQVAERFEEGPVGDRVVNSVTLSGPRTTTVGSPVWLRPLVFSTGGPISQAVDWSYSQPGVVTVDQDGFATGLSLGATTVTAASVADPRATASTVVSVAPAFLLHLWNFNESGGGGTILRDLASGADGQVINVGPNDAIVQDGRVRLAGGAKDQTDYVRLPDFLFLFDDMSIETWAAKHGEQAWARIFDFGENESNNLFMSWSQFASPNTDRVEWRQDGLIWLREDNSLGDWELDREYHFVMTLDADANLPGHTTVKWYRDGVLKGTGEVPETITSLSTFGFGPSQNWLGRSHYPDETANASYNEFRLYSGILTPAEIAANHAGGPPGGILVRALVTGPAGELDEVAMSTGESAQFSASVTSSEGPIDQTVAWSADDLEVATVNNAGIVTATGPGVGLIRATSLVNGNAKDTITVVVSDPPRTPRADAAYYDPTRDRFVWFKGNTFTEQGRAHPHPIRSGAVDTVWGAWPAEWAADGIDAAFFNQVNNKIYYFKGDYYARRSPGAGLDPGYPKSIVGNLDEWPPLFGSGGVDAAVYSPVNNKVYLFKDHLYSRSSPGAPPDAGYPRNTSASWSGWPSSWGEAPVDAVTYYPDYDRFYLFRNEEYVAHPFNGPIAPGFPKSFAAWESTLLQASDDVEQDFADIRSDWDLRSWDTIEFPDTWADSRNDGGHIQGLGFLHDGRLAISHSREGDPGFLIVGDGLDWSYLTDSSWGEHPGSMQASGSVLAIPEYDPQVIRFLHFGPDDYWEELDHLTFPDDNEGDAPDSVGLVYYPPHEAWWLIVGITPDRTETKPFPLYKSHRGKSLRDPSNRFVRKGTATVNGSETGMQLFFDKGSEDLYLITLYRDDPDSLLAPNRHRAVLTRIDLPATVTDDSDTLVFGAEQVDTRNDFDVSGGLFTDPTFRFGAGAFIDISGRIWMMATERCIPPNNTGGFVPCANDVFGNETEFFILSP